MDTIYTILQTRVTRHIVKIDGEPDADTRTRIEEAVLSATDIEDAIQLIEDEDIDVLAYDSNGVLDEITCTVESIGAAVPAVLTTSP